MYVPEHAIERETLRQGDILSGIVVMGAINIQGVQFTTDFGESKIAWTVPNKPEFADIAVLSHSCEVDKANTIKLTSIIVAPIRDINSATEQGQIEALKRSNAIHDGIGSSYLKYFCVEPDAKLKFPNGGVVDFSKCFSIRKNAYTHLIQRKILQLQDEARHAFGLKLALYFHRAQQPAGRLVSAVAA